MIVIERRFVWCNFNCGLPTTSGRLNATSVRCQLSVQPDRLSSAFNEMSSMLTAPEAKKNCNDTNVLYFLTTQELKDVPFETALFGFFDKRKDQGAELRRASVGLQEKEEM